MLDGGTTNHSLIAKEGRDLKQVIYEICSTAGASFISPFMGRMDDIGNGGLQVIEDYDKMNQRI